MLLQRGMNIEAENEVTPSSSFVVKMYNIPSLHFSLQMELPLKSPFISTAVNHYTVRLVKITRILPSCYSRKGPTLKLGAM
jgi:hypothetical protein